ncbi:MAG: Phosphatidylglycerol/phosphatidylinositol transfer protein [Geoglossum simile]|nr:MAG: Phosphatidylglycerol/phosphatidylinositol transfer protein [Geoglossum simile]
MNLHYALFSVLLASLVTAESLSFFGGNQRILSDELKVPGDSPLNHCYTGFEDDILKIDHVNLIPNPPLPGNPLVIEAQGDFKEDVKKGAYLILQVKYGLIRLVNTRADLCDQIKNVDLKCPLEKGKRLLTKTVDLPKEIPPGKYTVSADVFTRDDRRITCLTAEITFAR